MNVAEKREDILRTDTIARRVSVHFTKWATDKQHEESVKLVDRGIDSTLLATLNDFGQHPRISVMFSLANSDEAPLLRDYNLPSFLSADYGADDRLIKVRFTPLPASKVTTDKGTSRDKDGILYQCIEMKSVRVDLVVSDGNKRFAYTVNSNAKVYLTSGTIRLS